MGVYLLKNEFGEFKNIKPVNQDEHRSLVDNYGQPMKNGWKPVCFKWDIEDGEKSRDLFLYLGSILICNKKGRSAVETVIQDSQFELLPISIEKEEFYAVNIIDTYSGALDLKKSKIDYFKDGSIKWISEFVFSSDCCTNSIFHIKEMKTPIFVTNPFVNCVQDSGLIGLKFEECKQSKAGFLKSIFK